jgi:rSAM/selenodomain-associated transferase 1
VVGVAQAPTVALLARAPSAGGKRRLFAALGIQPDPTLLTALLLDTLDGALATGFRILVGVEPPSAVDAVRALVPPRVEVVAQSAGDLGDRMRALMGEAFARGADAVVLVGSDLPDLSPEPLRAAVDALAAEPQVVVLGPAADGGYYLVGATQLPDIFTGIAWGGPDVLAQTEAAADRVGLACRHVAMQSDVDRPADLVRVRARRTWAWVERARAAGQRIERD